MNFFKNLSFLAVAIILLGFPGRVAALSSYTFPAFNVGTLTGGGTAFIRSLNVSGVSRGEYLFVRVTANYQSSAPPHDGYPSTMNMELSDGGTNVFWPAGAATIGAVAMDSTNTLVWDGLFPQHSYQGGTNLTIQFTDTYTDASGPYYSSVSNVVVTIYPATTPSRTFAAFNVGTLTGGGATFTRSLDVSGLPGTEYLFSRVSADYQSAAPPHDAYSSTLNMELSDGGTNVFWLAAPATLGAVAMDSTNTLIWYGLFPQNSYQDETNLTIQFMDTYNDASGPYYSSISNVVATIYPATTPSKIFASFNVGTLAGGGPAFTRSLDASGLPNTEYLFLRVTANYQTAAPPHDAYPSTMNMELSDGGANLFWPAGPATIGAVAKDTTNTLIWYGLFPQTSYQGGTHLTIQFMDTYNDASGPYYSSISNVVVRIYPAVSLVAMPPQLAIKHSGTEVILTWTNAATGFTLQSATNLNPPAVWNAVTPAPVVVNGQYTVTNSISGLQTYYRLSQ